MQPERKGDRGRYPLPRLAPTADLLYAQVVKVRENGRVTEVKTKVIFGKPEASAAQLAKSSVSDAINTSFVERDNLTQRQSNRRLTHRTNGFSKEIIWFEKQLWLSTAYYHFGLPHHSLRQPLETREPPSWHSYTKAVETGHTRNGGRHHRACVDNSRVTVLSGTRSILGSIVKDQTLVCLAG